MSELKKPLAIAIGVALASSFAVAGTASADSSPFMASALSAGYMAADIGEGKGEEGKCGEDKGEEGKCGEDKGGEGSCGEDKGGEGSCGEDKGEEGKCGEGKCGEDK
jgi:uncharacterized low-complexity protein